MNTLERRIERLEGVLSRRMAYIADRRREAARAEERRRAEEEERAAAQAEAQARCADEETRRQAGETARPTVPPPTIELPVEPPAEPRTPPPAPPPEPKPPPWTYDPPSEMQIRPVTWRRRDARDYEDDPDDMYGKCIVDYDPLAQEDADYYDDDP